jgi:hypothetical protein
MGESEWKIRGGHRLWTAPEGDHSYALDNSPVEYTKLDNFTVKITTASTHFGWIKHSTISLAPDSPRAIITHEVELTADQPAPLAPWGLTVMSAGGTALIPLPPKGSHPEDLLPNQRLILWPYTQMNDPRFTWGGENLCIQQDVNQGPTKLGLLHQLKWVAYLNHGCLFAKSIECNPDTSYPDMGVNFEIFTNSEILELESLGACTLSQAGESGTLREEWVVLETEIENPAETNLAQLISAG